MNQHYIQASPASVAVATFTPTAASAGEVAPVKEAASPWLFSPLVDYACVGSLTFLVLLPLLLFNITAPTPAFVGTLLIWGNVLVNFPHYAATYYRVYRDKTQVLQYPVEAIVTPVVLAVIAVGCFLFPNSLTPWLAFAYLVTSGYHYSGQTFGVSMIFLGKAGVRLTPLQKRSLRLPIYSAYLYRLVELNVVDRERPKVLQTLVPGLNLPHVMLEISIVTAIVGVIAFLLLNAALYRQNGRALPIVVNMIVAAHVVWFTMLQFPILMAVVPFLHCLQYLLVTVFFDYKERRSERRSDLTPAKYFASTLFMRYYAIQVAVGVGLFVLTPLVLTELGAGARALVIAVVISAVNLHHFILDGAIWKLRKPAVRQALAA